MFDIDETILSIQEKVRTHLNDVSYELSRFNPYKRRGLDWTCITLNKTEMGRIFKEILQNGHDVGFITSGGLKKEEIKYFFHIEYKIVLRNFIHCHSIKNKTTVLKKIARHHSLPRENIYLIDNRKEHILPAKLAGFSAIYADNNVQDKTHGTEYIGILKTIIAGFAVDHDDEVKIQEEEKQSVILEKNAESSAIFNFSKKFFYGLLFKKPEPLLFPAEEDISEAVDEADDQMNPYSKFFP